MQTEIGLKDKLFNLAEAKALYPLVRTITEKHQAKLAPLQARLNKMLSNDPRRISLERDFENIVSQWRAKVELLGVQVAGLWIVEFDVGDGFLCWRYPELSLNYFRALDADFSDRQVINTYVEECDPDWAR